MSIDKTCETIIRQVCSSKLDYHMNQTPYSIYFSIRKKFVKGHSPNIVENVKLYTNEATGTEPKVKENILKGEISRLKLELEKKATLEEEFEKVEAVNNAIKKELNVTKARYEQQCTEMKHLRADIETS